AHLTRGPLVELFRRLCPRPTRHSAASAKSRATSAYCHQLRPAPLPDPTPSPSATLAPSRLALLLRSLTLRRGSLAPWCVGGGGRRRGRLGVCGRRALFAAAQPHIVDRMLDRMQSGARGEHPAGEDAPHLAL